MKIVVPAALLALAVAATGCSHNKPSTETAPVVTDVAPPPAPSTPPPAPVETASTPAPATEAATPEKTSKAKNAITGHSYVVQKGDTLFSIARRKYGHGSQANINKIENANPGLKPETLKIGQTIKLP